MTCSPLNPCSPNFTGQNKQRLGLLLLPISLEETVTPWHTFRHKNTHTHTKRGAKGDECVSSGQQAWPFVVTLACHNPLMHVSLLLCLWPWCSRLCHPGSVDTHTLVSLVAPHYTQKQWLVFPVNRIYFPFQVFFFFFEGRCIRYAHCLHRALFWHFS